jgi:galactokinase
LLRHAEPPNHANELLERLNHFVIENVNIQSKLPDRLDATTLQIFGNLARRSHLAAARLLKNQTPETNDLVKTARRFGAYAASSFGAGFGGSVWALIDAHAADQFISNWSDTYRRRFPIPAEHAEFFSMRPGIPACVWG